MNTSKGRVKLFIGPMYAEKSTSLGGEMRRHKHARKKCIIIRYDDGRYDDNIKNNGLMTHSGYEYSDVLTIKSTTLSDMLDDLSQYDVIGIDEIQFFPDNVECVQKLANSGKIIICAGLDGNYMAKPFGRIAEIMAIAEDIIKLKALCMKCPSEASFTAKIAGNNEEMEIGGSDKYIAVCRECMWG